MMPRCRCCHRFGASDALCDVCVHSGCVEHGIEDESATVWASGEGCPRADVRGQPRRVTPEEHADRR